VDKDAQDFTAHVPHFTLARFLCHYELFKRVNAVPGAVVDIGAGSGGSLATWAKLNRIFNAGRSVIGFDTFEGFPSVHPHDGKIPCVGTFGAAGKLAGDNIDRLHRAEFDVQVWKGDIVQTVPEWAAERAGAKIALLNLDADLYAPTRAALRTLLPMMAPGGIIIVDEYDVPDYPGEKKAVDEVFMERDGRLPEICRFPWYNNPSGFIQL
jgi:SAM-dependent methyltransferase